MKSKNHPDNNQSSDLQQDPGRKRSALWLVPIFFISGCMFFLGVIVGRGTAPALFDYHRIETEISHLAKKFTDSRKAQNDTEKDILAMQAELEYPEELKKKSESAEKTQIPAPEKPAKPAETPKSVRQETTPPPAQALPKSEIQTAGKHEAIEQPPEAIKTEPEARVKSAYELKASQARESAPERTPLPAPERTPAVSPKPHQQPPVMDNRTAPVQPVAIHLTSVVDKKSAETLMENLRSKGIPASITPKMIQGKGVWYTVVIGKYTSSTEADAMLSRLKQENIDASLVKQ